MYYRYNHYHYHLNFCCHQYYHGLLSMVTTADYYLYYNHCHYYCHCCSHCYHYCCCYSRCLYESKFCSCLITLIWSMREVKLLTICTNGWLVRAFLKNNQSINGSDFSHTLHKNSYRAQALTHKCNHSHGKWFMPSRNMQCEGPRSRYEKEFPRWQSLAFSIT